MAGENFVVEVTGAPAAIAALARLMVQANVAVSTATGAVAHAYEAVAKETAPVGPGRHGDEWSDPIFDKAGGSLRRSIITLGPTPISTGVWQAMVGPTVAYGKAVEFGLGERTVYPNAKQALYWPGAGHPVSESHPSAFAGRHYMERALAVSLPALRTLYSETMAKTLGV